MAAALGTWTGLSISKPKRIEGHTSNVETPILYVQFIKGTVGETTEAGDTYIIPHKFNVVNFITASPISATGATALYGNGTTEGASIGTASSVAGPSQITTAAAAGSTTVILTGGSAINDVYNECTLELRFSNGNVQSVKITDYVGVSATATLAEGLAESIDTTGTYYTVRGTLLTILSAAVTPTLAFEVKGSFN
jgi:hypothetical protein